MQAERQAACGRGDDLAAGQDARSGRLDRPQPPLHGPFCAILIKHALPGRAVMHFLTSWREQKYDAASST